MAKTRDETAEIQRLDQIPDGMTEDEEDAFWATHSLGDDILDQMEPFPEDFPLPSRAEQPESPEPSLARTNQQFPVGRVVLGLAGLGLLAVGGYLLYRLVTETAETGIFLPTKAPHLRITPMANGAEVAGLTRRASR